MSSTNTNDSEESIYLPLPIIMEEILIKLPAKSLCRFKAVSKLWNSVISTPRFAKAHFDSHNHSYSKSKHLFFQEDEVSWLLDCESYHGLISLGNKLTAKVNGIKMTPFGSSCGLICSSVYTDDLFFLCNPVLNQTRMIPPPDHPFDTDNIVLRGFGYVSAMDDFKLVVGVRTQWWDDELRQFGWDCELWQTRWWSSELIVYVFSLRQNQWTRIELDDDSHILARCSKVDRDGILVNQRLHWWTTTLRDSYKDDHVFAFDLLRLVFEEIQIPEAIMESCGMISALDYGGVSEIGGCLCLLIHQENNVELWMLKQYGDMGSWTRLYDLCIKPSIEYHFGGFFGSENASKLLIWCWDECEKCLIFLVDTKICHPELTLIASLGSKTTGIVNYVESLVSPSIGL